MESMQFETKDKNGNKVICEVIATYHDDDTNKDFIVYTDKTYGEKKLKVYYSLYKRVDNNIKLIDIIDSEDKKLGLQLIKEIINDMK